MARVARSHWRSSLNLTGHWWHCGLVSRWHFGIGSESKCLVRCRISRQPGDTEWTRLVIVGRFTRCASLKSAATAYVHAPWHRQFESTRQSCRGYLSGPWFGSYVHFDGLLSAAHHSFATHRKRSPWNAQCVCAEYHSQSAGWNHGIP